MVAKEQVVRLEPGVESGVELEITEGPVALDADEDTEGFGRLVGAAFGVLKAAEVLVDGVVDWEVSGLMDGGGGGGGVDGENGMSGVDLLEFLEKVQE